MKMIQARLKDEMEYIDVSRHARMCEVKAESSARLLEQRPNGVLVADKAGTPTLQLDWSWIVSKMAKF
jgi:hypothetical protein